MGEVFITRRGGGGSLNKSVIIITAPTGSTVTASMGGKTKRAKEENGTWTFTGLDFGEWTITATLLNKKRVITVPIDRLTVEYRTIFYNVWLYKNGDQCTDISGGWATHRAWPSFGKEYISMDGSTQYCVIGTNKVINFAKYSSVNVKIGVYHTDGYTVRDRLYVASGYDEGAAGSDYAGSQVQINGPGIFSLDTRSIKSSLKVFVEKYSNQGMTVEKVWLE